METTDIVIHKGDKEEKYQLYVEDYVMSYLKNYRPFDGRNIAFYGKREQKDKKYYIFGAGLQSQIPYFEKYTLLDEITCRFVMDMPVFSIREEAGTYELAGYYIFYQSNEPMQSYMIEQRKLSQAADAYPQSGRQQTQSIQPQRPSGKELQTQSHPRNIIKMPMKKKTQSTKGMSFEKNTSERSRGRLMVVQLSAIFVILSAIIINSTNSYSKLKDLNQAAVEVFFAMENEEATDVKEDNILRLDDIDKRFEEENQIVKQEQSKDEEKEGDDKEQPDEAGQDDEKNANQDGGMDGAQNRNGEETQGKGQAESEGQTKAENESNKQGDGFQSGADAEDAQAMAEQAFARNFAEYYQVEKGDTLCTISIKMYGDASKVKEICELNEITDPNCIKYGQKILLP